MLFRSPASKVSYKDIIQIVLIIIILGLLGFVVFMSLRTKREVEEEEELPADNGGEDDILSQLAYPMGDSSNDED